MPKLILDCDLFKPKKTSKRVEQSLTRVMRSFRNELDRSVYTKGAQELILELTLVRAKLLYSVEEFAPDQQLQYNEPRGGNADGKGASRYDVCIRGGRQAGHGKAGVVREFA